MSNFTSPELELIREVVESDESDVILLGASFVEARLCGHPNIADAEGRSPPPGFGIITRRTGRGRYVFESKRSSGRTSLMA